MDFHMSDEDFLEQQAPPVDLEADAQASVPSPEEVAEKARLEQEALDLASSEEEEQVAKPDATSGEEEEEEPAGKPADEEQQEEVPAAKVEGKGKEEVEGEPKEPVNPLVPEVKPIDFEAEYKRMMAPLRANGKDIELRSPDELVKLAQQGANYTQKLQQIAPHRKVLMMLQNNDLLDESKLSFLIDLEKKNPEAIKQLLKDAGVDPMDIDTSVAPAYQQGNHKVTDEEANFQSALDTMSASDEGRATLQVINTTWDQASKDLLWSNPEIMEIMQEQKTSGLYDTISTEIERRRMLGQLPANTSFLQAYKLVGDQMVAEEVATKQTQPAAPVARTTAAVKSTVTDSGKAKAATMSRTTPRQAKVVVNPLALSDDDFLKQFNGRL